MFMSTIPRHVIRSLVVAAGLAAAWSIPASGQATTPRVATCRPATSVAPLDALRLVVNVRAGAQTGAGVIVGWTDATVFIATADHVAFDVDIERSPINVRFYDNCGEDVPATVCSVPFDDFLDLALLCADATAVSLAGAIRPDMSRQGRPVTARSVVHPVGCPNGNCWGVSPPDQVVAATAGVPRQSGPQALDGANGQPEVVYFEQGQWPAIRFFTFTVANGNSGGALFNEWFEVVGIVYEVASGFALAIPMEEARERLCTSGSLDCAAGDFQLHSPPVPRAEYRVSIGGSLMSPSTGSTFPDGRAPSGRLNVMYQISPLVEIHAGALRLTPDDMSTTGGMLGVGLTKKVGRFLFNGFVEGGFARIEGRFDAGGFFVDNGGGEPEYVPFYNQFEDDALGYGVGAAVQIQLIRHWNLEVFGGHWEYSLPSDLPENTPELTVSPTFPAFFLGAGLRFGF